MFDSIKSYIEQFKFLNQSAEKYAQDLRGKLLSNEKMFLEDKNISEIKSIDSFTCTAQDSGFFSDNLSGIDYTYVKCAGAYYSYKESKIIDYQKEEILKELIMPKNILQRDEIHKFVSINRIIKEIDMAIKLAARKPDVILFDGSIVPQAIDKPKESSTLYSDYLNMISKYEELYKICIENNIILAGCIEDSRAQTLLQMLGININNISDTLFIDKVLQINEGLSFFSINQSDRGVKSDIKMDIEFYASYIKINDDYPLRIETISKDFDKVRNIVAKLSSNFSRYAYPAPIIDVDKLSRLDISEISTIRRLVERELSKLNIRKMRRERRI